MALQAFLQVGLSFADVGLFQQGELTAHRRFYLPQEPLNSSLKKFWAEFGIPEQLQVSSRFLEKILDAKLGGTVAQVVTSGFETWPILRQPVLPEHFDNRPYRQEPLASQELIFGLSERVNHEGQILKPVELTELEFINSKLKLMNVKRVCVNLLFAHRNPTHQNQVAHYFREQGFEVFAAERTDQSHDEMPAWRKNVINACLSGAFTEHLEEIQKSFGETPVKMTFLNQHGEGFTEDRNQIAGSLFAWANALVHCWSGKADQILYLGLENWFLISITNRKAHWESPWGLIESFIPEIRKLQMQPSLEVSPGFWGGIHFSKNELGFEPGPMSFGRALKPTVFDILHHRHPIDLPQIQASGTKKFKDQLTAMIKNIPELEHTTAEKLLQGLQDHLVSMIAMETQFKSPVGTKKTVMTGTFAPFFYPLLSKKWFDSKLELDSHATTRDLHCLQGLTGKQP